MADKIVQNKTLTLLAEFADGDTRTITLENPASSELESKVKRLESFVKANQIILGDKTGAAFIRFSSAKVSTKRITQLDIA